MAITISGSGITSANIADGTIVNADINSSAAIDGSKVTGLTSSQMPTGSIIQVVEGSTTTQVSTTGSEVATGITATITPTSASSKIVILVSIMGLQKEGTDSNARIQFKLYGGGSLLQNSDGNMWSYVNSTFRHGGFSMQQYDSPNTTSATAYWVNFMGSSGGTFYVQKDGNGGASSIILMEVAQ